MKVSLDAAEQEFERFVEKMDLELDEKEMSEDDSQAFKRQKNRLIKSICKGNLVIDENGVPIYTPYKSENKDVLTFHEPNGSTISATDRAKSNELTKKLYSSMAEMTKTTPSIFNKMLMPDLKVCMAIYTLFLDQ